MAVERPALLASSHWGRWQASHCSSSWSALRVQGAQGGKAATVSLPRSDLLVQTIRNTQQIYSSAKENKFVLSPVPEMIRMYKQSTFSNLGNFLGGKVGTETWDLSSSRYHNTTKTKTMARAGGRETHRERWTRPGKRRFPSSSWLRSGLCQIPWPWRPTNPLPEQMAFSTALP